MEFKPKTYIDVEELDLAKFVTETYGRPWCMQQGEMLSQNTYRIIDVGSDQPDGWLPHEAEQKLQDWLALPHPGSNDMNSSMAATNFVRDHYLSVDIILWDLCRRGIAPEGEYIIRIEW